MGKLRLSFPPTNTMSHEMYELRVENMSCGHCTARVTQAVKSVDADARVEVDLPGRQVRIESACELTEITSALAEAGYPGQVISDID